MHSDPGWLELDCPKCGVHNIEGAERCRICGNALTPENEPTGPSKECPLCKTRNDLDAPFCSGCGKPLGSVAIKEIKKKTKREKYYDRTYADYPGSAMRTAWAGVGGILIVMAAFFALVDAIFTIAVSWQVTRLADYDRLLRENPQLKDVITNLVVCQGLRFVFIIIAFAGGIFAIRRLRWGLAMVGGILGILALMSGLLFLIVPFWGWIELVLLCGAVVGVIQVGVSRREFLLA
jgi:hypothetical protein